VYRVWSGCSTTQNWATLRSSCGHADDDSTKQGVTQLHRHSRSVPTRRAVQK
jgi:hypothetical protein